MIQLNQYPRAYHVVGLTITSEKEYKLLQLVKTLLNRPDIGFDTLKSMKELHFRDLHPMTCFVAHEIYAFYHRFTKIPTEHELLYEISARYKPHELESFYDLWAKISTLENASSVQLVADFTEIYKQLSMEHVVSKIIQKLERAASTEEISEEIIPKFNEVLNSLSEVDLGYSLSEDAAILINQIKNASVYQRLPVGNWSLFNYVLRGGIGKDELTLYVAPPGKGKTTFLINIAALVASTVEKNILCITTELLAPNFAGRLYRRMLKLTREEMYNMSQQELLRKAKRALHRYRSNIHVIYRAPGKLSVDEIDRMLETYKQKYGEVDVLVLDFLDKLEMPQRRWEAKRMALLELTDNLRAITLKHHISLFTATQANREALKHGKTTGVHVSEGIGKYESADVVIAMQQTEDDRAKQRFQIRFDKVRELFISPQQQIHLKFNPDTFLIEEDQESTLRSWGMLGVPFDPSLHSGTVVSDELTEEIGSEVLNEN